jgi:outer membrane protein
MRKSILATLIASALVSFSAHGADLLQIYQQAQTNDPQFASVRSSLKVAQERVVQANAVHLPSINLQGSNSRTRGPTISQQGLQTGEFNTSQYSLSLTQHLYQPANLETYEQSKLAVASADAQLAQARLDLMIRTAQAYFDVLTAEDALVFTKAQKEATTEQLASAKRNFEVGTQTITDTHEAQAAYDLVVSQEFAAMNDLEIRRTALQQITGQVPGSLSPLKAGASISAPQPAKIDAWVETAEKQNNNVIVSQFTVESAKREIKKDRAGHKPTLDLVASSSFRANGPLINAGVGPSSTTNSIALQWAVPIFSGYAVTGRIKEAIAQEEKTRFDLETAKRAAAQSARQAFLSVNSGLAQVKALEAAEVSSKSSLESNKLGYQVGVRINIDVLNAQRQLFSTRKDLAKARYDTLMSGLRLKAAAGVLAEEDLTAVNALLQK